jgi:mono/diheme cytochrome c family protein
MRPGIEYAVGAAVALLAGCGRAQVTVDRALQRMQHQPRGDAYAVSGVFADGKVMQAPPPGTVARERVLDAALATGRDSSREYLRQVPVSVTAQLLARGRSRFRIFCGACHGVGGFGGSVVASNFTERRPPSLRTGGATELPPGRLYEVIRNGVGRMPSYAADLSVTDRWAVVAYTLTLRARPATDVEERDDSTRAAELRRLDSLGLGTAP